MRLRLAWAFAAMAWLAAASAVAQPVQTFTPGAFDRVVVTGQARIELSQGDKDQVTVVGDAEAARGIVMDVTRRGELLVSTEGDWKFWSSTPVLLRVQMREIRQLTISGMSDIVAPRAIRAEDLRVVISGKGDVRMPNLTARQLRFDISGAGDADLGGAVDELVLQVSGAGRVSAGKLRAKDANVRVSGAGNSDLWVTDELNVVVSGPANVSYWGNPNVRQRVSSFGSIVARGEKK